VYQSTDHPLSAKKITTITFDFEMYVGGARPLTEIGVCTWQQNYTQPFLKNPGAHGENLLEQMCKYHYRIKEYAHLVNRSKHFSGDPTKNRFGQTNFFTTEQAKLMIEESFCRRDDQGHNAVILMGHALRNDESALENHLNLKPNTFDNVVTTIDTQMIASEHGHGGRGKWIDLEKLCQLVDVPHLDLHTAMNDAMYTVASGVKQVLGDKLPTGGRDSVTVFEEISAKSRGQNNPYGIHKYCTRCGEGGHLRPECYRLQKCVFCEHCIEKGRTNAYTTHVAATCERLARS
jgi:hypothetical protein